jgi:hypothetical protein
MQQVGSDRITILCSGPSLQRYDAAADTAPRLAVNAAWLAHPRSVVCAHDWAWIQAHVIPAINPWQPLIYSSAEAIAGLHARGHAIHATWLAQDFGLAAHDFSFIGALHLAGHLLDHQGSIDIWGCDLSGAHHYQGEAARPTDWPRIAKQLAAYQALHPGLIISRCGLADEGEPHGRMAR